MPPALGQLKARLADLTAKSCQAASTPFKPFRTRPNITRVGHNNKIHENENDPYRIDTWATAFLPVRRPSYQRFPESRELTIVRLSLPHSVADRAGACLEAVVGLVITRRRALQLIGAVLLAVITPILYPFAEVFGRPRAVRYAFTPRNWTPGLTLRIAVLSDIHACEPWMSLERIGQICAQTQELEADIIVLLGDYVNAISRSAEDVTASSWAKALSELSAPLGLHAILGNHDYGHDEEFQRGATVDPVARTALLDVGIPTYRNQSIRLEKDGLPFWLAGLDDQLALWPGPAYGRTRFAGLDDLDATLSQITDQAPVLLLAHEPDIFDDVPDRVSVTLSGHTHGGQINIFGWRPWAASRGSRRYPAGYFNVGGRELIVSRGLGCSSVPIRIGNWPEILLVELGDRNLPEQTPWDQTGSGSNA